MKGRKEDRVGEIVKSLWGEIGEIEEDVFFSYIYEREREKEFKM